MNLLGWDFYTKRHIKFSSEGKSNIIISLIPTLELLCSLQVEIDMVEAQACSITDLCKIPEGLWAISIDIRRIKTVETIKVQIDYLKPLPKLL
jgi:hypothetical protein